MKNLLSYLIRPVLSIIFRKKNDREKVSVLAFKLLGDAVFSIPAVRLISENFPEKKIILFCFEDTVPIYQIALKNIEYVTFKRNDLNFTGRVPRLNLIRTIRKYNSAVLFDLTSEYQTAVAAFFSGASEKIGFNTEYFENIFNVFTPKRELPDLTDMHLEPVLKYFNINAIQNRKIFIRNFEPDGKILIHPFAGWKAKEWDLSNYINLAEELNKVFQTEFIVPEGKLPAYAKEEINKRKIGIIETASVNQLIEELRKCSLVVSNDTGPIYIAALLGKATFSIYGPTNPLYSLPNGNHHGYISEIVNCSPEEGKQYCFTYGGRYCKTFLCMTRLSYDKVKNSLETFIDKLNLIKVKAVDIDN